MKLKEINQLNEAPSLKAFHVKFRSTDRGVLERGGKESYLQIGIVFAASEKAAIAYLKANDDLYRTTTDIKSIEPIDKPTFIQTLTSD